MKNGEDKEIIDKVFEIVSNDEVNKKFLDYNNNKEYFSINGQEIKINKYLAYLGKIFGGKDKEGNLSNANTISKDFYIPELEQYKNRYSKILDNINMDRYVNLNYEFKNLNTLRLGFCTIIRKGEEPDWRINDELNNAILGEMPNELSLEEKAIYIYCKLCKVLSYDEGYFYKEKLNEERYEGTFLKEHLEGIKPNSKITCFDFSRIFFKMINELEGDIESVIIAEGINQGHYLTGFYTDKVSVMLEAINGRTVGTNDLMKAKNGIEFEGIDIISDKDGIINKAIKKIYPQIYGKEQISIQEYMKELKILPREESSYDFATKLQSFVEIMRENNISGNEAIQTLTAFYHSGFFGEQVDRAYMGKKEMKNGEENYKRLVLMRPNKQFLENSKEEVLYVMDTDSLDLSMCTPQEILEKIKIGEYVYENEKHKMPGIDMEEK